MKVMLKHVLVMMLLAPTVVWGQGFVKDLVEATPGNGLEVDSTTSLKVLIEEMSEEAKNIGLTYERIEARVNQSLRKAGITPESKPFEVSGRNGAVYLNVAFVAKDCFRISLFFARPVFYRKGDKWFTNIGNTWHSGKTGIAHGPDYILDGIAEMVEVFCNEFLKANGK